MMQINLGWCGALIVWAMIIVSVQCLGFQETYEQAMLKCSKYKDQSARNICRMDATERYRNVQPEIKDETFYIPKTIQTKHVEGYIIDFKQIFKGAGDD